MAGWLRAGLCRSNPQWSQPRRVLAGSGGDLEWAGLQLPQERPDFRPALLGAASVVGLMPQNGFDLGAGEPDPVEGGGEHPKGAVAVSLRGAAPCGDCGIALGGL